MSDTVQKHPSEEELIQYALGQECGELEEHITTCSQCYEFVEEMRIVKAAFSHIDEQPVSGSVRNKIFESIKKDTSLSKISHFIQHWYTYPFFIGLLTIFWVLFLYFIYIFSQ
ncbi:hypothetical protein QA601_13670 [Chitinispirillales bacterium ANBcel5]|uniref:hypothetical protein n=1 Tax=Cellulosispirillum alkaliphilum TaxID=3039283 RepID=UPI002A4FC65E|nr:hypothetical protein [Chitinispirillales bacterium ANBcel5]